MPKILLIFLTIFPFTVHSQSLKLKNRKSSAVTGSQFAKTIADSTLSAEERERKIYRQVRHGNVPSFYRSLVLLDDSLLANGRVIRIRYYVLPDFLAIGSNDDYFYVPMRPGTAQKVGRLLKCSLPTRKISDRIYQAASVKMVPQPIPPSAAMTTVPVFMTHSAMVRAQRNQYLERYPLGALVAGNKKDVVISNKMVKDGNLRVVIYGWHQPNGKAIQPLYNGHTADWADYSHGVRLVQKKVWVDGKRMKISRILKSPELHGLLSDEGVLAHIRYPQNKSKLK